MVFPFPVDVDVLTSQSFPDEPALLQDPLRRQIRGHDPGFDAMQVQNIEPVVDHPFHRLAGISFTIEFLIQGISDKAALYSSSDDVVECDRPDQFSTFVEEYPKAIHGIVFHRLLCPFDRLDLTFKGIETLGPGDGILRKEITIPNFQLQEFTNVNFIQGSKCQMFCFNHNRFSLTTMINILVWKINIMSRMAILILE